MPSGLSVSCLLEVSCVCHKIVDGAISNLFILFSVIFQFSIQNFSFDVEKQILNSFFKLFEHIFAYTISSHAGFMLKITRSRNEVKYKVERVEKCVNGSFSSYYLLVVALTRTF